MYGCVGKKGEGDEMRGGACFVLVGLCLRETHTRIYLFLLSTLEMLSSSFLMSFNKSFRYGKQP